MLFSVLTKCVLIKTILAFSGHAAFPALLVPPPSATSPSPLSAPPCPHNTQVSGQEAHQKTFHQRPETQAGEVQTLLCLLQEGMWQLPFLPWHEEVWWARAHEEGLHLETVFSGEVHSCISLSHFSFISFYSLTMLNVFNGLCWTLYLFLQPALPNTARCAICREGEHDESNPSTYSLMECTVCSQIVHRQCIKVSNLDVFNKYFATVSLKLFQAYCEKRKDDISKSSYLLYWLGSVSCCISNINCNVPFIAAFLRIQVKARSIMICQAAGNVPNVTKEKTQHQRYWSPPVWSSPLPPDHTMFITLPQKEGCWSCGTIVFVVFVYLLSFFLPLFFFVGQFGASAVLH